MLGNFMAGRYGTDQLSIGLLIGGMVLTFFGNAFDWSLFTILSYVMFLAFAYRTLSRDISARQKENEKFLQYYKPVKSWLLDKYKHAKEGKSYKYFKCPECKQELRVPIGRGKILVTCSKCKNKFEQKS